MEFSRRYIRFNWISLVLIYLIVVAGSLVRITGSGMGCPDWPKCFGQWVPPTELAELPAEYRQDYLEKREKKVQKFCRFLTAIGMDETAKRIQSDPKVYVEEAFNARKTWTEYVNRLVGFLAGNFMLVAFIWMLVVYRKRKYILLMLLNLILMGIEGWFGSIVVATNLVPWTITVHLFLALVIIGIQLYIVYSMDANSTEKVSLPKSIRWILLLILAITFYQMFLGTQVREAIDALVKLGFTREQWIDRIGMPFFIHRSFSWLVLMLLAWMFWKNEKGQKYVKIRWAFVLLALELITGVLLAYADMPGLVQTSHLIFASVLFGLLLYSSFETKKAEV
ncbi:MAG: COX15/CtaA family protein [Flavobacteriales bacterium]